MSTSATYYSGADTDGGYIITPSLHYSGTSSILMGDTRLGSYEHCRTRIANVTIPKGSTIISATLSRYVLAQGGSPYENRFYESADSPVASTTYADFTGRSVSFIGADYPGTSGWITIDVTGALQALVNRSGWASGNAVQFFFYYYSGGGYRQYVSYAYGSLYPKIDVEYDAPLTNLGKVYIVGL